jgi:hypothetical protein
MVKMALDLEYPLQREYLELMREQGPHSHGAVDSQVELAPESAAAPVVTPGLLTAGLHYRCSEYP